ncbi:DUF7545 family protein [Natranaeroarchaeum sulfidigenes]|uniref:Uncharacterized protein n=1 Tax=Natranaeroarchaeum sulfidigenes TaxID=2784880 RepID=A0A897MQ82_9EURY|nr:hypothetical protein [Natranaeroarchaeum sulfidigenes]QSG02707.1 Uncharacterized protein AArcS_1494 [Natranaeroarchaeum sulfidigenes]
MANETVAVTVEADDESTDELEVPTALLDLLSEGEEPAATVVSDMAMISLAQRIHGAVHHAHGEPDDELQAIEEETMELFEERFGATFAELTGHDH